MMWRLLALCCALVISLPAYSAATIEVRGLFKDGAVLVIDGNLRMMKAGQTSPEGVRLISADTRKALIELDGQRQSLGLSKQISASFQAPQKKTTAVHRDGNNQYLLTGAINGVNTQMLVDTGANAVAMSSVTAQGLGIDFRKEKNKGRARTASGTVTSYHVMLDSVSAGEITLRNVRAFVNEGEFPHVVLLGMSFLRHVEMRDSNGVLYLEQ